MKSHNGPWKITGSELKYENPWISVREDQVIRLDGKPGIFGIVDVMPGASVLALDADNNVYLTREYKYAMEREGLEVVSGGLDGRDEDPLRTAQRELKEEAGIRATTWTDMGLQDPLTTIFAVRQRLFLAEGLTFGERHLDGNEKIDIIKMPFAQALEKVMKSEITHSSSMLLILKTALLRPELLQS